MRALWLVDIKWIAGLLAWLLVIAAGILVSLERITEHDTAHPLASAFIAIGISDRVSDEDYAKIEAASAADPNAQVSLTPVAIPVSGREIAGLTKDQASLLVAGKLAEVLYERGEDAAKALIPNPPPGSKKSQLSLGPAGTLSGDRHSDFSRYFRFAAIVGIIMMGVVAFVSRGLGRIGAPAVVVAAGCAPLAVLWTAVDSAVGPGDPGDNVFERAARLAFSDLTGDLSSAFLTVTAIAGAAAVVIMLAGIATPRVRRRIQRLSTPNADPGD